MTSRSSVASSPGRQHGIKVPDTSSVVGALRSLVVFGPDQAGAYRELASDVSEQLGADVPTQLTKWLVEWATSPEIGLVIRRLHRWLAAERRVGGGNASPNPTSPQLRTWERPRAERR